VTPLRVPKPLKRKLEKKDAQSRGAILACLVRLREDWRHPGLRSKRLSGRVVNGEPVYEVRVTRSDRVTFFWDGDVIVVENHCRHDEALRRR
jgi:hypothetical protein